MNKTALFILDGWGIGKIPHADAILQAKTPYFDQLWAKYPHSTLLTFGESVGLPEGQMGNSEVGHLNLGAGRIVYQDLAWVSKSMHDHSFQHMPTILKMAESAKNKDLHLIGLVSDGGVHSHIDHLIYIIRFFSNIPTKRIWIHVITDGRDTDPKSGLQFVEQIEKEIKDPKIRIASLIGRYYAMDRDKRWDRVAEAYHLFCDGEGELFTKASDAVQKNYDRNITDEFIRACKIGDKKDGLIKDGDAVFCYNFRTDRLREITEVLSQSRNDAFSMKPLTLDYFTMTKYDEKFQNINIVFEKNDIAMSIGEVVSMYGGSQLRIAETEKYPHVSFFFSGGREKPFTGEERILIPSPKVATYDLQPEMSAYELTNLLLPEIEKGEADFICLNYANTDMVGHTGIWQAAIKAAETVDKCVEQIVTTGLKNGYTIFLTADHGNSDYLINEDGSPNTAHTLNPVPFFIVDNDWKGVIKPGKLADIAPTILTMMEIPIPKEMTGQILISKS